MTIEELTTLINELEIELRDNLIALNNADNARSQTEIALRNARLEKEKLELQNG